MEAKEMAGNALGGFNKAQSIDACRENAQAIARSQLKAHEQEAAAWRWLDNAMTTTPMTLEEEAALWNLLCRARRERY